MYLYSAPKATHKKEMIRIAVFMLLLFLMLGVLMLRGNRATDREEGLLLRDAIRNAAVTHYAIEGRYPATLEQIVTQYGIVIDSDRFLVRYSAFASNIMPQIMIRTQGE